MFFYTSTEKVGNKIFSRGYRDKKQFFDKVEFKPTLYIPSKTDTRFKNIYGDFVEPISFESMSHARSFIEKYKDIDNFSCFGMEKFDFQYRSHTWREPIEYDESLIKILYYDIETSIKGGYPNIALADKEINAITIIVNNEMISLGLKDFKPNNGSKYYKFVDEAALLKFFILLLERIKPDIISGWNIDGFDIPYTIRRIIRVLGEEQAKRISPWGIIREKQIPLMNGVMLDSYDILGIQSLDYMVLYKKYGDKQDSYSLGNVSQIELGTTKVDYGEYGNLHNLYEQNHQLYMEYNQKDTELLPLLEKKKKFISMTINLAYFTKCNYSDTFKNTRLWDSLLYNFLLDRNVIVDTPKSLDIGDIKEHIAGGHVKLPKGGMYNWVITYDATSLYPSLIMSYNISPETFIEKRHCNPDIILDALINKKPFPESERLKNVDCGMAANGAIFSNKKIGYMPQITKEIFSMRKSKKDAMLKIERELEEIKNSDSYDKEVVSKLEIERQNLDSFQLTLKILLNSLYGAMANAGFRYNHSHFSEAITLSGQLSIRWAEYIMNLFMNTLFKTDGVDYVIYCDTDSVMLNGEKIANLCKSDNPLDKVNFLDKFGKEKIQPYLEKMFNRLQEMLNYKEQKIFFKREKICDKGIFMPDKKKRYILSVWDKEGTRYHEPKIGVTGIEAVRSSTPMVVRDILKKMFKLIMTTDNQTIMNTLEEFKTTFFKQPPEIIGIPSSANNLIGYANPHTIYSKATPQHVRGALLFNHELKRRGLTNYDVIKDSEKVKTVFLKMPNPIRENVISFSDKLPEEFGLDDFIDYETQYNKTLIVPIEKILDVIGWKTKETADLGDFLF